MWFANRAANLAAWWQQPLCHKMFRSGTSDFSGSIHNRYCRVKDENEQLWIWCSTRSTEVVVTVVVDFIAEIECKWRVRGIKTVLFAGVTGHHLFPVCRDVISPCFGGSWLVSSRPFTLSVLLSQAHRPDNRQHEKRGSMTPAHSTVHSLFIGLHGNYSICRMLTQINIRSQFKLSLG